MFLFAHPEVFKGVVINSGMYVGRGVDKDRIPLVNSPTRGNLDDLYLVGVKDPHYETYLANWRKSREQLMSYGHPAAKMREEVIQAGNADGLSPGHDWYPTRILGFCDAVESKARQQPTQRFGLTFLLTIRERGILLFLIPLGVWLTAVITRR